MCWRLILVDLDCQCRYLYCTLCMVLLFLGSPSVWCWFSGVLGDDIGLQCTMYHGRSWTWVSKLCLVKYSRWPCVHDAHAWDLLFIVSFILRLQFLGLWLYIFKTSNWTWNGRTPTVRDHTDVNGVCVSAAFGWCCAVEGHLGGANGISGFVCGPK